MHNARREWRLVTLVRRVRACGPGRLLYQAAAMLGLLGCAAIGSAQGSAATNSFEWSQLPPLPEAIGLGGPLAGISGGTLVVAGGANFPGGRPWDGHPKIWHASIYLLRPAGGEWTRAKVDLPRPLGYAVCANWRDPQSGEEKIVCVGGSDVEQHHAECFALVVRDGRVEIEPLPPAPQPVAMACGAIVGNVLYVAGGLACPSATETLHTFWALDLASTEPRWQPLPAWPGPPRMLAVAGAQGGSFYLFGGVDLARRGESAASAAPPASATSPASAASPAGGTTTATRAYLRDAYRFTPKRGWQRIADLPRAAAAAATPAPAVGQSHLLVLGGDEGTHADRVAELKNNHPGFADDVLAYHTLTDTWVRMGVFPRTRGSVAGPAVTTVAVPWSSPDGLRFVLPSGETRPGVRTAEVWTVTLRPRASGFRTFDYVVLAGYLATMVGVGFYFARRESSTADFFLGGRRIAWWAAGLSIFGTQLSALTFMALPATAYATNWLFFLGNMMIVAVAPLVVWVYLPHFRRLRITTAYEFLEERFDVRVRWLGAVAFVLFQLGRMGITLYLPSLALATVTGINIWACIVVMGALATLYTALGGIEAVIWTDVLQVAVLLGGAVLSLVYVVVYSGLELPDIWQTALAADKLSLGEWTWDLAAASVWVVVIGRWFDSLVPYTADQTVVQRYLTTASEQLARRSIWTNAVMTVPASLLFFSVGTALWVFYRAHPELLNPTGKTDDIFAWFIAQQLPVGVSGLVIAGLFAAAMSSLDSSMNSIAAVLTGDFVRRVRPNVSDAATLRLARWLTVAMGVVGTLSAVLIAWLDAPSLWTQYLKVLGLFGGALAGLFALGVMTQRTNSTGALVGFLTSTATLAVVNWTEAIPVPLYAAIGVAVCMAVGWTASWLLPGARGAAAVSP